MLAPPQTDLKSPVGILRGIGPERSPQLERLGITSIDDLLLHRPRRYEDRRSVACIRDLEKGMSSTIRGVVVACGLKRFRFGSKSVFELVVEDGTGRLHCRWWNLPFMKNYFAVGNQVLVFGKVLSDKPRTIDHPETEVLDENEAEDVSIHLNRIVPVYPLTEGLPQRWLRSLMWRTLEQFEGAIISAPESAPRVGGLPARAEAIRNLHFPARMEDAEQARTKLAFDELFELQTQLYQRRRRLEQSARALPCGGDNRWMKPFLAGLSFKLTDSQTGVLKEIRRDMSGAHPMRRLLQGDVGSGKTVVAGCAALMAMESGHSALLMAPTEILAEQHGRTFRKWFQALGLTVVVRTASHRGEVDDGKDLLGLEGAGGSNPVLMIGTHALIARSLSVPNVGLVIIDEQHKFGVTQREALVKKGRYPHLLVMTATPIPRTLGLTLYGDLDSSVIEKGPASRGIVKTVVRTAGKLPEILKFVSEKISEGRQVYFVFPRVENAPGEEVRSVTDGHKELSGKLKGVRIGLLHGRLPPEEKDRVMNEFSRGEIQVLVATSIIEVGVDVSNATVMVIHAADQFGLAQLHQLRGRIGRSEHAGFCILLSTSRTAEGRQRLNVMEKISDGFEIAEEDMKLRGPGDLLGADQSGIPRFRFADLGSDLELIKLARRMVREIPTIN